MLGTKRLEQLRKVQKPCTDIRRQRIDFGFGFCGEDDGPAPRAPTDIYSFFAMKTQGQFTLCYTRGGAPGPYSTQECLPTVADGFRGQHCHGGDTLWNFVLRFCVHVRLSENLLCVHSQERIARHSENLC